MLKLLLNSYKATCIIYVKQHVITLSLPSLLDYNNIGFKKRKIKSKPRIGQLLHSMNKIKAKPNKTKQKRKKKALVLWVEEDNG